MAWSDLDGRRLRSTMCRIDEAAISGAFAKSGNRNVEKCLHTPRSSLHEAIFVRQSLRKRRKYQDFTLDSNAVKRHPDLERHLIPESPLMLDFASTAQPGA